MLLRKNKELGNVLIGKISKRKYIDPVNKNLTSTSKVDTSDIEINYWYSNNSLLSKKYTY